MRLQVHGVSKAFGPVRALHRASLEVAPGEIHALLGESGAGKSTLLQILSGVHPPDSGRMWLDGKHFASLNPRAALRKGVAALHQEQPLVPDLSVERNIVLGCEPSWAGWINATQETTLARKALEELHPVDIPLDAQGGSLTIAQQRRVGIARALLANSKLLLLDEPTRWLTATERENLFAILRERAARGTAILCVSPLFEELKGLCHRYTVLRDGETIASGKVADLTRTQAVELMAGREVNEVYPRFSHHPGKPVLQYKKIARTSEPVDVDLTLHTGEIFGIAGLTGSGRRATLRALFGLERPTSGQILVDGKSIVTLSTPSDCIDAGIGFFDANHAADGFMLNRSIADNLTLSHLADFGRLGFIVCERQWMGALDWMEKLHVKTQGPIQELGCLSAGDRQKIAIGRLLQQKARILLLNEPTQGIDQASKTQIYELMGEMASQGKSIVFVSSYLPELLGVCDTLGVMRQGRLVAVRPATDWTESQILEAAGNAEIS